MLASTLVASCLVSSGIAYRIRIFADADCTGVSRDIHVKDNSCYGLADFQFLSFQVLTYGGDSQYAWFYNTKSVCDPLNLAQKWWADGSSNTFLKDNCIYVGFMVGAVGSWGLALKPLHRNTPRTEQSRTTPVLQ